MTQIKYIKLDLSPSKITNILCINDLIEIIFIENRYSFHFSICNIQLKWEKFTYSEVCCSLASTA